MWAATQTRRKNMSEEKSLAIRTLNMTTWETILSVAPVAMASRLFGVATKEQAAAIMLKGYELGLGLSASFEFIHVIDGKPSISPKGMMALIHNSGQLAAMDVQEGVDKSGKPSACTVMMRRTNGFEHTITFTMEDAKTAGLIKPKGGWVKYPANMLRWRAIGFCADVVFPDLIGGMYRPEELGATVDAEGDVIEGQAWVQPPEPPSRKPPEPASVETVVVQLPSDPETPPESTPEAPSPTEAIPTPTLADLIAKYGVDAIMAANSNTPPASDADLVRIAGILEGKDG
jgi:hypothetical protein